MRGGAAAAVIYLRQPAEDRTRLDGRRVLTTDEVRECCGERCERRGVREVRGVREWKAQMREQGAKGAEGAKVREVRCR